MIERRFLRGITLPQVLIFLAIAALMLTGVSQLASQWTILQATVARNGERIASTEAVALSNEQRIQATQVRVSALELWNKDLMNSMKSIETNTKTIAELLAVHVYPRVGPDGSIESGPPNQ